MSALPSLTEDQRSLKFLITHAESAPIGAPTPSEAWGTLSKSSAVSLGRQGALLSMWAVFQKSVFKLNSWNSEHSFP